MKKIVSASLLLFILLIGHSKFYGMDFEFRKNKSTDQFAVLVMKGTVRAGDFDRFRKSILNNLNLYRTLRLVELSSNGGDLIETLRIAKIVRAMYASITVPKEEECASSCFFLFMSGVQRFAVGRLGIHRPYFDQAYFAGLSIADAEQRQVGLMRAVNSILENNSVPRSIVELMNRTSSSEIRWLTWDELDLLGRRPAWYEEILIAKCKFDPSAEPKSDDELDDKVKRSKYWQQLLKIGLCEDRILQEELKKLPAMLKSAHSTLPTRKKSVSVVKKVIK